MRLLLAAALVCFGVSRATADPVVNFTPPGLSPGDTYHIAFITDGVRNAASIDINDYNAFVQSQAEISGAVTENWGVDWFAIASTETANARDNALVSAPVYLLDQTRIATGFADLWDGNIASELDIDQFGTTPSSSLTTWTGSGPEGTNLWATVDLSFPPGGTLEFFGSLGTVEATTGSGLETGRFWVGAGQPDGGPSSTLRFYALSEPLTVGAVVPEPSSSLLSVIGAMILGGQRRRSRV